MKVQKLYSTIDLHVAGEAFRIIKDMPYVAYRNLEDLHEEIQQIFGDEINLLLNEPRGFAGMNGCLVVPPTNKEADVGVLFLNHEGAVSVSYGGLVAVITALLENGHLRPRDSKVYSVETVSGVINMTAHMENDEVTSVTLESELGEVARTGYHLVDSRVSLPYTLVQKYAIFEKSNASTEICVEELTALKQWGRTTLQSLKLEHSVESVVLMDASHAAEGKIKTITFREDHQIVRSPGFGTTMACYTSLVDQGQLDKDLTLVNESIFGSFITVQPIEESTNHPKINLISRAFMTGIQLFVLDPTDPLPSGFLLK